MVNNNILFGTYMQQNKIGQMFNGNNPMVNADATPNMPLMKENIVNEINKIRNFGLNLDIGNKGSKPATTTASISPYTNAPTYQPPLKMQTPPVLQKVLDEYYKNNPQAIGKFYPDMKSIHEGLKKYGVLNEDDTYKSPVDANVYGNWFVTAMEDAGTKGNPSTSWGDKYEAFLHTDKYNNYLQEVERINQINNSLKSEYEKATANQTPQGLIINESAKRKMSEVKMMEANGELLPNQTIDYGMDVYKKNGARVTIPSLGSAASTKISPPEYEKLPKVPDDKLKSIAFTASHLNETSAGGDTTIPLKEGEFYLSSEKNAKDWNDLKTNDVVEEQLLKTGNNINTALSNARNTLVSLNIGGVNQPFDKLNPAKATEGVGNLWHDKSFAPFKDKFTKLLGMKSYGTKGNGNEAIKRAKEIYTENKDKLESIGIYLKKLQRASDILWQSTDNNNKGIGFNRTVYNALNNGGDVATFKVYNASDATKSTTIRLPVVDPQDIGAIESMVADVLGADKYIVRLNVTKPQTKALDDEGATALSDLYKSGAIKITRQPAGKYKYDKTIVDNAGDAAVWDVIYAVMRGGDSKYYRNGIASDLYKQKYGINP